LASPSVPALRHRRCHFYAPLGFKDKRRTPKRASARKSGGEPPHSMKVTRYSRYTGAPADAVDLEDLVNQLSDYLLPSGFESPYSRWGEFDPERSMESLRQAILQALEQGDLLSKELLDDLTNNPERSKELERLLDRLLERLS